MIEPTGRTHELKTWPAYFEDSAQGHKNFEFRKNDRAFRIGDWLLLREWETETGYSGRTLRVLVTYILRQAPGLPEGYCVMETSIW